MLPYALVYGEKYPRRCASARPLVKEMGQSPHCKRKYRSDAAYNECVAFSPFVRTCFHTVNISRGGEYIRDAPSSYAHFDSQNIGRSRPLQRKNENFSILRRKCLKSLATRLILV